MNQVYKILFIATNGVGLGHLTRALGVAKQVRRLLPSAKIIFLGTSVASHVVEEQGFLYYYIPSKDMLPNHITADIWNKMFLEKLREIQSEEALGAVVFDGVYPYQGLTKFFVQYPTIKTFWLKREGNRRTTSRLRDKTRYFEHIIVPKEIKEEYGRDEKKFYCEPIIMVEEDELLSRQQVHEMFRIPKDKKVFYIQLGAGIINDITTDLKVIIEYLLRDEDNFILVGESIIGKSIPIIHPNIKVVRHYPNAIYYRGCDFAISAAGYNSFHELIYFNIPTLFIPNTQTVTDDQVARAYKAEELGVGICLVKVNELDLHEAIHKLNQNRKQIILNAQKYLPHNGVGDVAHYIINHL